MQHFHGETNSIDRVPLQTDVRQFNRDKLKNLFLTKLGRQNGWEQIEQNMYQKSGGVKETYLNLMNMLCQRIDKQAKLQQQQNYHSNQMQTNQPSQVQLNQPTQMQLNQPNQMQLNQPSQMQLNQPSQMQLNQPSQITSTIPNISSTGISQTISSAQLSSGFQNNYINQPVISPATSTLNPVPSPVQTNIGQQLNQQGTANQQPQQQLANNQVLRHQNEPVDENAYRAKLKQLQKYIEPLSKVIHKFNEDDEKHNKDYLKMKNLRDTLMNPQKRIPWSTLEKCEKVLQSWLDKKPTTKPQPQQANSPHNQHMCQSIFNTIGAAIQFKLLHHTLKRTFQPVVDVIEGDYNLPETIADADKMMMEACEEAADEDKRRVCPHRINCELKSNCGSFYFQIDERKSSGDSLHIVCHLIDHVYSDLGISPLHMQVNRDYPNSDAKWIKPEISSLFSDENKMKMEFEEKLVELMEKKQRVDKEYKDVRTISNILNCYKNCINACTMKHNSQ